MNSNQADPFAQFAARYRLELSTAELAAFPRDVLAAPGDLQAHTLAALSGPSADAESIRVLFITDMSDARPVSLRDVLWWLASDCWAIEQAGRDYARWAAVYGYADTDAATLRLFKRQVDQAETLINVLSQSGYGELLEIYRAEVPASDERTAPTN